MKRFLTDMTKKNPFLMIFRSNKFSPELIEALLRMRFTIKYVQTVRAQEEEKTEV